jgi:hypothetical protein
MHLKLEWGQVGTVGTACETRTFDDKGSGDSDGDSGDKLPCLEKPLLGDVPVFSAAALPFFIDEFGALHVVAHVT